MKNKPLLLTLLFLSGGALAKDLELEPSLSVSLGYSDNVELDASNEKSSAYTKVSPRIKFKKEGSKVSSQLDYSLTGLYYASEEELNDVQHRLNTKVSSELVNNALFLGFDASISQQLLSNDLNASNDGVSGSQNLTQTYNYSVIPSWKKNWNNFAESSLKYTVDEVFYEDDDGDDSLGQTINLDIESGTQFLRYFWQFNYQYQDVNYDNNNDTRSEKLQAQVGYRIFKKLDLILTVGDEDYNANINENESDTWWRAGFGWQPTSRTNLTSGAGRRFLGKTYILDFQHRSRFLLWRLNYNDSVTDTRQEIVNNNNSALEQNTNNTVVPLTNFTTQFYLSKRFTGSVSYQRKKSTYTLAFYNDKRYFQDSDVSNEQDYGLNLTWDWKMGRRMSMKSLISWREIDDEQNNNTQEREEISISLTRKLSRTMTGDLKISYNSNEADIKDDEYTEHAISINVVKQF